MEEKNVYLDTSAIVKRYIKEKGTNSVDLVFDEARGRKSVICFSFWNIGEAIGIFDKYERQGRGRGKLAVSMFLEEMKVLKEIGSFDAIELKSSFVTAAIEYVLKYHLYIADAIQLVFCKSANCTEFLTADKRLASAAKAEGINSILLS